MDENQWEIIYETSGPGQAELLRGLLEANEIPVFLSQEGAGRAYGFTIGRLGRVEILVPESKAEQARQLIKDLEAGKFQDLLDLDNES